MQNIFETMGAIFNPVSDLKTIVLNRLDFPFNYNFCFHGKSHCSTDGQLWGVDTIEISKSKTAITIVLKKGEDVYPFKTVCFIRSIDECKAMIETLAIKYPNFFNNFGKVTIY